MRAKVTEGISLASSAKIAVSENAANGKNYDSGWVAPAGTSNVTSVGITAASGIVTITYTASAGGASGANALTLRPYDGATAFTGGTATASTVPTSGNIIWICGATGSTMPQKFLPAVCRGNTAS